MLYEFLTEITTSCTSQSTLTTEHVSDFLIVMFSVIYLSRTLPIGLRFLTKGKTTAPRNEGTQIPSSESEREGVSVTVATAKRETSHRLFNVAILFLDNFANEDINEHHNI